MTYEFLQMYWWFIVSLLGAILVFMLFVQGGQTMLLMAKDEEERTMMANAIGRKWELTFTTLVTFGGAFFASFPLFYSTSFGGAYWLWILILFSFVVQAVSYEFRSRKGNIWGKRTFDTFLLINGFVGTTLLGVAVGIFFFGGAFTVSHANIVDAQQPVISTWAPSRGLEAIADWRCLLLGVTVLFLARTLACLYFINSIADEPLVKRMRKLTLFNGIVFVVFFLAFTATLLLADGLRVDPAGGFKAVDYIYLSNYLEMPVLAVVFVVGVLMVLYGVIGGALRKQWRGGIWWAGIGTVAVVLSLLLVAGYNDTAYYRSTLDPSSSLTISNSSSSVYTLTVMSWVSLLVPFVLAYIAYVWRAINRKPIDRNEMAGPDHKY